MGFNMYFKNLENRRWTKEEDDYILINKYRVDLDYLGRTQKALKRRYEHLETVLEGWSEEQDEQVLAGDSVEGKTEKAIRLRRSYLKGTFYEVWDEDTIKLLKQLYLAGKKNWEIAEELGIEEDVIKKRLTTETRAIKGQVREFLESRGINVGRIISAKMINEFFRDREALARRLGRG